MRLGDFEALKSIADRRSEFEFLRKTETWPEGRERQFILGSMDRLCNFLKVVSASKCGCCIYEYNSFDPEHEATLGRINILSRYSCESHFEENYECACTSCGTTYRVTRTEARFGFETLWIKMQVKI